VHASEEARGERGADQSLELALEGADGGRVALDPREQCSAIGGLAGTLEARQGNAEGLRETAVASLWEGGGEEPATLLPAYHRRTANAP